MNLFNDTKHESGIFVYEPNSCLVHFWGSGCDDDYLPKEVMNITVMFPFENGSLSIEEIGRVEDVREELPGKVWVDCDVAQSDMDIIKDDNFDIPGLFGVHITGADVPDYEKYDTPYTGTVYEITTPQEKIKLICPDLWE